MPAKIYRYRGLVNTVTGWASELDMPLQLIQAGLRQGLYIEDLIPAKPWFQLLRNLLAEEAVESTILNDKLNSKKEKLYTYAGESKTLTEWSEELGVSKEFIRKRFNKGHDIRAPYNSVRAHARKLYTYKGETKTLLEFMDQYGLSSADAVRKRITRGKPLEEAIGSTTPKGRSTVERTGNGYAFRGKHLSVREISKCLGISPAAVRWRIKHGVPLNTAVYHAKVHKRISEKQEEVSNNNALAEFLDATATTHQGKTPDLKGVVENE